MEINEARAEQRQLEEETSSSTSTDDLMNDLPAPDGEQNSSDEECTEDDEDFVCCIDKDEISAKFSDYIGELQ